MAMKARTSACASVRCHCGGDLRRPAWFSTTMRTAHTRSATTPARHRPPRPPPPPIKVTPAAPKTWKLGEVTFTPVRSGQAQQRQQHAGVVQRLSGAGKPRRSAQPHDQAEDGDPALRCPGAEQGHAGVPRRWSRARRRPNRPAWWPRRCKPLLAHRDVLLLDQRGTGGSNALKCEDRQRRGQPPTAADGAALDAEQDACRRRPTACKQLSGHADPRYYTTTIAVAGPGAGAQGAWARRRST